MSVEPATSDNPHHPMRGTDPAGRRNVRVDVLAAAARRAIQGAKPTAAELAPIPGLATPAEPAGLEVREVMAMLQISRTTLWRLRREGKLRAWRQGGRLVFDQADIEAFRKGSNRGSSSVEEAA